MAASDKDDRSKKTISFQNNNSGANGAGDELEEDGNGGPVIFKGSVNAPMDPAEVKQRKKAIIRSIIVMSLGFVSLVAAMQGLVVLQSSLNAQIGIIGLGVNFLFVIVSCLLFSTFIVQKIGCKWAIVLGMSCITVWMASNFYVHWGTVIPAAMVMGLGWAPLWTAHCTFFTVIGVEYAKLTDQMPDIVIAKFFGAFFMIFMTGPIWGNIISAGILNGGKRRAKQAAMAAMAASNSTAHALTTSVPPEEDGPFSLCGAAFCPRDKSANVTMPDFNKPEPKLVFILVGVYVALGVLGVCIIALFLKEPNQKREKTRFTPKLVLNTLNHLRNKYQLLLIPLTIYTGMEQAFIIADYTKGFVTCALGVEMLGLVVICFAFTGAIVSLTSGQIVKKTGRLPIFLIGIASHLGVLLGSLFWVPDPNVIYPFFILAVVWGVGDAICQTQINALYSVLFSDRSEAAFSNYRMWESVGIVVSFGYSNSLCVSTKIYIILVVMAVGVACYIAVEVMYKREQAAAARAAAEETQDETAGENLGSQLSRQSSRSSKDSEDKSTFHEYANYIRRKSSVFVPGSTLNEAADAIKKKSSAYLMNEDSSRLVRRKLSVFVPEEELGDIIE